MNVEELLKNAKPILFNTEMVRAILDGIKTCTRRVIKLPYGFSGHAVGEIDNKNNPLGFMYSGGIKRQPYQLGDIMYVRETWQYLYELDGNEQIIEGTGRYYYAATDTIPFDTYVDSMGVKHERVPWRPSIHMPKEAARIFLKVKDVRVERLQDMDINEMRKEGLSSMAVHAGDMRIALEEFKLLWDSTIKKCDIDRYGWEANPYVWRIEFQRLVEIFSERCNEEYIEDKERG